jgi:RNA polymerase sigma factor (sigma-70 family)
MASDRELLLSYVQHADESAFGEFVRRHVGIVYSAALRRTGGRAHLAEDVSQRVFTSCARQAVWLVEHPAPVGWLFRTTRNAAIDAIRSEARRENALRSFAAMPDNSSPCPEAEWDRLRPVLDEALDRLPERDRDIILLRYFSGLSFPELGERLSMSENAARMRAARALEKLRRILGARGVGSSTAALGLLLSQPVLASAPAGLAGVVSAAAVAGAPAGAATGILPLLIMSKITTPLVTAALVAGLLTTAWYRTAHAAQSAELARIQHESERLSQLAKEDNLTARLTTLADTMARQNAAKTAAHAASLESEAVGANAANESRPGATRPESPRGHQWCGQATPLDAGKSFAWACDATDVEAIAKLLWFEPTLRDRARQVIATMPASVQAEYPTPEEFYAFVIAADALVFPPPVSLGGMQVVTLGEGRAALRREGSSKNYQEYQLTPEGWKYVMPARGVERWPANLNGELLVKLYRK